MARTLALYMVVVAFAFAPPFALPQAPERRIVPVNVLDGEGNPVPGLRTGDFHGNLQGKPVTVLSITPAVQSPRIVILLDASHSMFQDKAKWKLGLETVDDLVRRGPALSEVALVLFSDAAQVTTGLTRDRQAVLEPLAAWREEQQFETMRQAAKRTALLDAILGALEILEPARPGDGIYVITDGEDTASQAKEKEVRRRLGCAGVRLFSFVLPTPLKGRDRYMRGAGVLDEISRVSGGQAVIVEGGGNPVIFYFGKAQLREVRQMYKNMETYYQVEIEVAPSVKERTWRLFAVDKASRPRTDLQLIYPRRIPPCR